MSLRRAGLAILIALGASSGLSACDGSKQVTEIAEPTAAVQPLTVQERIAPDYRIVSAVLTNRDVGDARARIGGKLSRVLVREGDVVKPGQVVAVISDERVQLEAQASAASVAVAEAAAERARSDLARSERLFEGSAISVSAIETARTQAKAAEAQLRAARAQAAAAAALRDQGRVTAPAAGKVTRIPAPQGAVVMPGEVVVAISTGARVLRLELPEGEAKNLQEGGQVRILVDENGGKARIATIRQVYPAIESGRVMADLDAPEFDTELVGARVRVLVPAGERAAIVIPGHYIVTRYGADYVRLSRPGGAVIEAPIQRGSPTPTDDIPDGVEVLSGLRPGDQILPPASASAGSRQ